MLYPAGFIGHRIDVSQEPEELRVGGVTKRGVFLFAGETSVSFLSSESYRGPLTINLCGGVPHAEHGQRVRLEAGHLHFPGGDITDLTGAAVWRPPEPQARRFSPSETHRLLREIAQLALTQQPAAGLVSFLAGLFDLPSPPLPSELLPARAALKTLLTGHPLPGLLIPLMGLGRGLTPSGDDFICGYLLMRARRGLGPLTGLDDLLAAARSRTTLLSAELIACASQGSADERLLTACDSLLNGSHNADAVFSLLAGYGSSSGIDAFCGMALEIIAAPT